MSASQAIATAVARALDDRPDVLEAYLFGSETSGRSGPLSDVDVAVFVDESRAPSTDFGLAADLTTRLTEALGRPDVDVVVLNDASPLLYHRAITRGVRVFSRDLMATTTREGRALSRYCDFLPVIRRSDAALASRLAAGTFGR